MIDSGDKLVFLVLNYIMMVTGVYHTSTCLDSKVTALNASCPVGQMLQIVQVLHGYSDSHKCSYSPGDCTSSQRQQYHCVGTQNCSLPVTEGTWLPSCERHSNYLQVDYDCITANQVHDICDNNTKVLTAQSGYIASPNYPQSYGASLVCEIQVKVYPDQTIKFDVIDMNLTDTKYYDCLMMSDHISSNTWCNTFANEPAFTSRSNKVNLKFSTNEREQAKGFWIFYRAIPAMGNKNRVTSKTTTTTTALPPTEGAAKLGVRTEQPSAPESHESTTEFKTHQNHPTAKSDIKDSFNSSQTSDTGSKKLPVGAIIGLVLGSLTLIMISLIALLVVRRVRERRRKRSDSLHMIFT